jgi:hypothetical protein
MAKSAASTSSVLAPAAPFRFDRMEWAGACGDLGTLIPFLAAYVALAGVDPFGMLLAFGLAYIATGIAYRAPVPVQPMKAAGAVAATQAAAGIAITPEAICVAALATGAFWLLMGATGAARRVGEWVGRPVIVGLVLGLGLAFLLEGVRMMAPQWWIAAPALAVALLLLDSRAFPSMFFLLLFGAAVAMAQAPDLPGALAAVRPGMAVPAWPLGSLTWDAVVVGIVFLALPQVPLTLGNAIVGVTEVNNRLFPQRPQTESRFAVSTGLINLGGGLLGGVPMCHGAGGLAAHYRFGARSGTAPIAMGVVLVVGALLFSESFRTFIALFPAPVLGVMVFLAGAQLALGSCDLGKDMGERFVTLATAGIALFNVGAAFAFGIIALAAGRRGWLTP